jgi:predicted phage-related endonuclease
MGEVNQSSALELWRVKLGKKKPDEANERMVGGNKIESFIADCWYLPWLKDKYPDKDIELVDPGALFHPVHDWMAGTPDRICYIDGEPDHLVEIKSHGHYGFSKSAYSLEDKSRLPADKKIQGRYYLKLVNETLGFNLTEIAFPVLWDTHLFDVWCVEYSKEEEDRIFEACKRFMTHNVRNRVMPEPDGSKAFGDEIKDMWRTDNGKRLSATSQDTKRARNMLKLRERIADLKAQVKPLEKEYSKLKQEFETAIGDNLGIDGICDWKSTKGRPSWQAIAKEANAPLSLIRKHTTPGRSFSLKYKHEEE